MIRRLTILVLCIVGLTTSAQTTFEKAETRAGAEYLSSVIHTANGGFAAMGDFDIPNIDKWLVRMDIVFSF